MKKISICILTYNRKRFLSKLLSSLSNLKYSDLEIIVVDNHSEDGTEKLMAVEYPGIQYFRTRKNIGVGARNIGLNSASGDIIITIDDDITGLDDNSLVDILKYFNREKSLGALNFKVIDKETGEICNWIHHCKEEEFSDKEFFTYEITEGAVAFRKEVLQISGGYPEYFFLSHEGPDIAFRILEAGYDVMYSNVVCVKHARALEGRKSWFRYYYDTRNQFWLALRNFPLFYSIGFLSKGLISTFVYSLRDGFLIYWLKGFRDGLVGLTYYYKDRKKLSSQTMERIRIIDKKKPSFIYMIKKRLFRKEIRL